MPADALWFLGDILVGLLGGLSRSPDDDPQAQQERRRERAIRVTLEAVAEQLPGRVWKPFLRARRVEGFIDGRPVTLIWRGAEHVELRAVAPPSLRLSGGVGGLFQRLLFGPRPQMQGSGPQAELVLELLRAGRLDRLEVAQGQLVAALRPGLNAARIVELTRQLMGSLWGSPAARVVVSAREATPTAPAGGAAAEAQEHRCPFCHDAIAPEAVVVNCASCDAPHHPTCFEEGHGCAIAGCRQAKARGARQSTR